MHAVIRTERMMRASMWWRRAVARLSRRRLDDELRTEIQDHLERRRQQLVSEGMSPAAAEAAARRAFGNVASVREQMHDGWGFPSLDSLLQDARYGARILLRAPGFTAVAVLSLSLGIGAAAAVFNLADAVLFRPLSVRDPGSLRAFRAAIGLGGVMQKEVFGADPAQVAAMRTATDFADVIAFRTIDDVSLAIDGDTPHGADGAGVARVLRSSRRPAGRGADPAAGRSRTISPSDRHQRATVARRTGRGRHHHRPDRAGQRRAGDRRRRRAGFPRPRRRASGRRVRTARRDGRSRPDRFQHACPDLDAAASGGLDRCR